MLKKTIVMASLLAGFNAYALDSALNTQAGITGEQPRLLVAGETKTPPDLSSLLSGQIKGSQLEKEGGIPLIRAEAIKEAAASLGARDGMAKVLDEVAVALKKQASLLDAQYDFSKLALSIPKDPSRALGRANPYQENGEFGMILPPVVLTGADADSFPSEDEMRIADQTYKVYAKSRLIPVDKATGYPVVPNWRDYLIFSFPEIQLPHESLLPRTEQERALWDEWVKKGWADGQRLGRTMFNDGFARLRRDFNGMLNYRLAYGEGMITRPQVAGVNMGVTGGGSEMRINDRVVRITDHSAFITDKTLWAPNSEKK